MIRIFSRKEINSIVIILTNTSRVDIFHPFLSDISKHFYFIQFIIFDPKTLISHNWSHNRINSTKIVNYFIISHARCFYKEVVKLH